MLSISQFDSFSVFGRARLLRCKSEFLCSREPANPLLPRTSAGSGCATKCRLHAHFFGGGGTRGAGAPENSENWNAEILPAPECWTKLVASLVWLLVKYSAYGGSGELEQAERVERQRGMMAGERERMRVRRREKG